MFKRQISYEEMTYLLQFTIDVPKSQEQYAILPFEPQRAPSLTVSVRYYPAVTRKPHK